MLNKNTERLKISNAFKQARNQKGLSQQQLAELTGLGIATIKRFESGKFWLNSKQLVILSEALEIELNYSAKNEGEYPDPGESYLKIPLSKVDTSKFVIPVDYHRGGRANINYALAYLENRYMYPIQLNVSFKIHKGFKEYQKRINENETDNMRLLKELDKKMYHELIRDIYNLQISPARGFISALHDKINQEAGVNPDALILADIRTDNKCQLVYRVSSMLRMSELVEEFLQQNNLEGSYQIDEDPGWELAEWFLSEERFT